MLFLQFKINDNKYILEARDIIEVVPYANLKRILKAPAYVAGLLNYRGNSIPVIDINFLMSDKPCEVKLSSRIALVNYKDGDGLSVCIGLLIEHLTETVRYNESDFSDSGVTLEESPYLGKVVIDDNRIIQMVNIGEIIPEAAHDVLFHSAHPG
jgi:chemotaxis-related protein WspB